MSASGPQIGLSRPLDQRGAPAASTPTEDPMAATSMPPSASGRRLLRVLPPAGICAGCPPRRPTPPQASARVVVASTGIELVPSGGPGDDSEIAVVELLRLRARQRDKGVAVHERDGGRIDINRPLAGPMWG